MAGYKIDIRETLRGEYKLPVDTVANRLMLLIHYYTPWTFVGMEKDEPWGKVRTTWGSEGDWKKLIELFDDLASFSRRHSIPIFLGEFSVASRKEKASGVV